MWRSNERLLRIFERPADALYRERAFFFVSADNEMEIAMADAVKIDFAKMDGLVPGIVQDAKTGEMLMLGFLNETSYAKTLETGFVTFWSRTRSKLWMKGETSGNRLRVIEASTDCDNDALLFKVEVEGDGLVCHEGTVSCFTKTD